MGTIVYRSLLGEEVLNLDAECPRDLGEGPYRRLALVVLNAVEPLQGVAKETGEGVDRVAVCSRACSDEIEVLRAYAHDPKAEEVVALLAFFDRELAHAYIEGSEELDEGDWKAVEVDLLDLAAILAAFGLSHLAFPLDADRAAVGPVLDILDLLAAR